MAKIAMYWGAGCGGCDVSLLGIHEALLDLLDVLEIVFWPCATDFKYEDLEKMKDKSIDVAFYNGAIRTEENEHIAKLLRKKAKLLVAYGSCASKGCVIGLANLSTKEDIFDAAYLHNESTKNPDGIVPQEKAGDLELPAILPYLKTLDQVVEVDAVIPGCPPPTPVLVEALNALLEGKTTFGKEVALCDECPRKDTKPDKIEITKFYRWHEKEDNGDCFLAQNMICMGPATRAGCGGECIAANIPCTGCMGTVSRVKDQGASMMSAIASLMEEEMDEEKERELIASIHDMVGTFYKYSAARLLPKGRLKDES
ncbi:MAG TPA: oxidoreductase [Thermoplasmatales archaeon]|nr:MAG: oxidoreductase [Thermoplasmata archaeon]RLF32274.1 MAG: oxidoreductase [Thermoplasmata archaeon]HDN50271.1 oxidoreductase [Thermoplasmatales archaeon]